MDDTNNRGSGRTNVFNCFKPMAVDEPPTASLPPSSDDAARRRRKRLRRSFSAALKAVLFKSSLLKKSRSENSKEDRDVQRSNFFSKSKRLMNSMKKTLPCKPSLAPEEIFRTNSDRSSIFSSNSNSRAPSLTSSSSVSSCSSHSRSGSDKLASDNLGSDKLGPSASLDLRQTNQQKSVKRRDSRAAKFNNIILTLEMCVILISLGALIWGKTFAIVVCTSTWLFYAPVSRRREQQLLQRVDSFDGVDSEEYKKKVIMEGLLERNR